MKLITLEERKPEAEKSSGDVTLLMAIKTSTWRGPGRQGENIVTTCDNEWKLFLIRDAGL